MATDTPTPLIDQILDQIQKPYPYQHLDPQDFQPIVSVFHTLFSSVRTLQNIGNHYITECIWCNDTKLTLVLHPHSNSFHSLCCNEAGTTPDLQTSFTYSLTRPSQITHICPCVYP